MSKLDLMKAFQPGHKLITQFCELTLTSYEIGKLTLNSGKLVACDPLVFPGTEPFAPQFKSGHYPVILSVGYNPKDDNKTVAYAMLRFNEQAPIKWQLATKLGEDLSVLSGNEVFGYGVDSGTGCFMDADAGQIIVDNTWKAETYEESLSCKLGEALEENYNLGFNWANLCVDDSTHANVIAFDSGEGDGFYASYFGLDAEGCIVAVVTEFMSGDLL
ncbi:MULTISPECIES: DUF4241 domain-containing protein [Kamptonema]|uniref:DUF4241 domain-containing protein n=1 Tax=Kamptonema TaxID=1501433 RepID=UPI0001DACD68|nr:MULTISPECIES: DUF4241 domain-containing protein [Kamptonema]CBN55076.1 conserved hypothetical protein [Kamptonema sp. PCC 6506]